MTHSRALRDSLGRFATGVTVVTATDAEGLPYGVTVNSFSSVSLEPPRVLWSIAKVSQTLDVYLTAAYYAINVLNEDQRPLAQHFAQSRHDLYADLPYTLSTHGAPLLTGCLAWLECATYRIHDCGDHYIVVGDVTDYRASDGQPLVFFASRYRALQPD